MLTNFFLNIKKYAIGKNYSLHTNNIVFLLIQLTVYVYIFLPILFLYLWKILRNDKKETVL